MRAGAPAAATSTKGNISSVVEIETQAESKKDILFGRNLAHVDSDTDDLASLHAHRAGGVVTSQPAC